MGVTLRIQRAQERLGWAPSANGKAGQRARSGLLKPRAPRGITQSARGRRTEHANEERDGRVAEAVQA